jgi:hypothetical protein
MGTQWAQGPPRVEHGGLNWQLPALQTRIIPPSPALSIHRRVAARMCSSRSVCYTFRVPHVCVALRGWRCDGWVQCIVYPSHQIGEFVSYATSASPNCNRPDGTGNWQSVLYLGIRPQYFNYLYPWISIVRRFLMVTTENWKYFYLILIRHCWPSPSTIFRNTTEKSISRISYSTPMLIGKTVQPIYFKFSMIPFYILLSTTNPFDTCISRWIF